MEMYVYVCSSATILHKSSITIKNPKTIKYYTKKKLTYRYEEGSYLRGLPQPNTSN